MVGEWTKPDRRVQLRNVDWDTVNAISGCGPSGVGLLGPHNDHVVAKCSPLKAGLPERRRRPSEPTAGAWGTHRCPHSATSGGRLLKARTQKLYLLRPDGSSWTARGDLSWSTHPSYPTLAVSPGSSRLRGAGRVMRAPSGAAATTGRPRGAAVRRSGAQSGARSAGRHGRGDGRPLVRSR